MDLASRLRDLEVQEKESQQAIEESGHSWPAPKIRSAFVEFFTSRGHTYWPSSPVAPHDDPTLLFSNAGMNQFKPLFLGTADPSLPMSQLTRACNSQKCIRAGGKHNDLEDVGRDVYHHTFFEMLGNWSFGDYFKEEAVMWAWECLTKTFGLNPDRLYATYFGGDESQGLAPDEDTRQMWLKYLPESRILPFGCKDNFWEMGDVGPCGPCTEIHYDRIGGRDASKLVNADLPDVLEIWNVVFIQFNREQDGALKELPNKHVDTGMGFERLASILQGKTSNYDTDVFVPIFDHIKRISQAPAYTGKVGKDDVNNVDTAYRVVADHIRTLTFAISDGAVPSNDGRGYVLRRVLRRGVRYGQQILGAEPGFFHQLVRTVVELFQEAFPELAAKEQLVVDIIRDEEMSFNRTLEKGLKCFSKMADDIEADGKPKVLPGKDAFFLYATMGFPLDLTQIMAEERDFTVDTEGFQAAMDKEQAKSAAAEAARKGAGGKMLNLEAEQTSALLQGGVEPTDASSKYVWHHTVSAKVLALYAGKGEGEKGDGFIPSAGTGTLVGVIVDSTPFYAEQGGQTFDTGLIAWEDGSLSVSISNCQSYAGYVVHTGYVENGTIAVGQSVNCMVDYERRALIAPNHTMTHVLNYALRSVLLRGGIAAPGMCDQKGSMVDADKLRFDFSWSGGLKAEELEEVESIVRAQIAAKLPVHAYVAPLAQATQISSLRQVFGEAYPDPVRVLSVGQDVPSMLEDPTNAAWGKVSVEFCGGTHLTNTSQAVTFAILEESGIAKGVRRIVAVTKDKALQADSDAEWLLSEVRQVEKLPGASLEAGWKRLTVAVAEANISIVKKNALKEQLAQLSNRVKEYKKVVEKEHLDALCALGVSAAAEASKSGSKYLICSLDGLPTDAKLGPKVAEAALAALQDGKGVMLFSASEVGDRFQCYCAVPNGVDAKKWVTAAIGSVGGKATGKGSIVGNAKGYAYVEACIKAAIENAP
jgi:alanyl-tRNA synthetase